MARLSKEHLKEAHKLEPLLDIDGEYNVDSEEDVFNELVCWQCSVATYEANCEPHDAAEELYSRGWRALPEIDLDGELVAICKFCVNKFENIQIIKKKEQFQERVQEGENAEDVAKELGLKITQPL